MWVRSALSRRVALLVAAATLTASGCVFFSAAPTWIDQVPADSLAVVVVREMPDDLEFLDASRLGEWFDDEGLGQAASSLTEPDRRLLLQLREQLNAGWLALHRVERKTNGALRPHLTGLLRPAGRVSDLQSWLESRIAERFGSTTMTDLEDGTRLLQGRQSGQIFYMKSQRGSLLLSNSTEGWNELASSRSGTRPDQAELVEALQEPAEDWDLLVYFRGPSPLELVPSFLYRLDFDRPTEDDYRPLEEVRTGRTISIN